MNLFTKYILIKLHSDKQHYRQVKIQIVQLITSPSCNFHHYTDPGVALAFFKMRAAYAHLTKKCVRATKICVSVYYRSNYHLGQKHEQQQQIHAFVQTYSLNQSFPVIAAFVGLDSSNY